MFKKVHTAITVKLQKKKKEWKCGAFNLCVIYQMVWKNTFCERNRKKISKLWSLTQIDVQIQKWYEYATQLAAVAFESVYTENVELRPIIGKPDDFIVNGNPSEYWMMYHIIITMLDLLKLHIHLVRKVYDFN